MEELQQLPVWLLVLLGLLVLIQIVLEVWALIVLFRTPDERLLLGKKLPWVLIILFVNTIGAVLFLVAGRIKESAGGRGADSAAPVLRDDAAARAVDVLYGPSGDSASTAEEAPRS